MRELDIAPLIADDPRPGEIETEVARRRVEHAGRRLAALAGTGELADFAVGVMRAVVPRSDVGARLRERLRKLRVRRVHKRVIVQAERDTTLVGDDHDRKARRGEPCDGLGAEREES